MCPEQQGPPAPGLSGRTGALLPIAAIAALGVACGGGRFYKPMSLHVGRAPGAAVDARLVSTWPASESYPPSGVVNLRAVYQVHPGTALTSPQLASATSAPCSGGIRPRATADVRVSGRPDALPTGSLEVSFARDAVDRNGLLWRKPTVLDMTVLYAGAPAGCLRMPLVEAGAAPEWMDVPTWSFGMGFRLFAPLHRIYGVDAASMFVLRFGRWLGPVRLRAELAGGGALANETNANLVGYSYGAGLLADYLLLSAGRFGLGVAVGYDLTGISFAANIDSFSHDGAGFAGPIYGPRAGLSFAWIPQPPPGSAFRARPDARSITLEIFGAALSSQDQGAATGALWFMLSVDAGGR
jgi:hypothetical protein